jgi:FkbM family methyltransferase
MKELIYKIVNFFTFGRGLGKSYHGHAVRLPTRYVNYFPAGYEKDNFDFLTAAVKQGDTVLDVGAHIGLFAVIASKLTGANGKVIAFEPAPATFNLLQQTVKINKAANIITTIQKAVGSEPGKTTFFISDSVADNSNSLVSYLGDRPLNGIDIDITSIDTIATEKKLEKINFIKIDVEGAEYDTLRGAAVTFKTFRPHAIVAIHPVPIVAKGDKLEAIYDLIVSLNYRITLDGKDLSREAFLQNRELIDLHIYPQ